MIKHFHTVMTSRTAQKMQLLRIESAKVRKSERIISSSIIGNIVVNPSLASLTSVGTRFRILLLTSY